VRVWSLRVVDLSLGCGVQGLGSRASGPRALGLGLRVKG
jgi:predicted RNA methylase